MNREELTKIFDWLEKEMNPKKIFYFKLTDNNQISAYIKGNNHRFCIFYIKPILRIMSEQEKKL